LFFLSGTIAVLLLGFCFSFLRPNFAPQFFPPGASLGSQNGGLTSLLGLIEVNPLQETIACLLLLVVVFVIFLLPILFSLLFYAPRIFFYEIFFRRFSVT
jgi:hypothetical protein